MDCEIRCTACNRPTKNLLDYKCRVCSNPLDVRTSRKFESKNVDDKVFGFWRYARFFPYVRREDVVTLGEGWTPLVKHSKSVSFKLENLNPTGSFKDRGSTTLISATHKHVKKAKGYIAEDSSGNAGASVAAYAARAELRTRIYVPETVAGPKFSQIQFHGAEAAKIAGTRSEVAEEAQKPEKGKFYVGHILHPLFRDGVRSLAYEIAEQFGRKMPDRIYLPCSAGTLLLGVLSGLQHLVESGAVETMPTVIACQTSQVSPLYHRFKGLSYRSPEKLTSVADALVSTNPPLLDLMVERLEAANGDAVLVEEEETLQAFAELARQGFFVEPSSAVAHAAYRKQLKSREVSRTDETVIVLTGSGLKTTLTPSQQHSLQTA